MPSLKLSLRDLFWLALVVAGVTVWWTEHREAAEDLRAWRVRSWFVRRGPLVASDAERRRLAVAKKVAALSDEELNKYFASIKDNQFSHVVEYEPCLAEMARRRMSAELERHYEALMAECKRLDDAEQWVRFPNNLELLTALRRAQNNPTPLCIDVTLSDRWPYGDKNRAPTVFATIENADPGKESVRFTDGGDDRGGRRERWKLILKNARGHRASDSNFSPMLGGGVSHFGPLAFGKRGNRTNVFDIRRYVAPPSSGKYQLEVFYHNEVDIADQQDLTGLIVSKSDPVWVTVHNPTEPGLQRWTSGPHPALAILAACGVLFAMSLIRPAPRPKTSVASDPVASRATGRLRTISRRDLVWSVLLVAIAIGFWLDSVYQARQIQRLIPDAEARWTISLAE